MSHFKASLIIVCACIINQTASARGAKSPADYDKKIAAANLENSRLSGEQSANARKIEEYQRKQEDLMQKNVERIKSDTGADLVKMRNETVELQKRVAQLETGVSNHAQSVDKFSKNVNDLFDTSNEVIVDTEIDRVLGIGDDSKEQTKRSPLKGVDTAQAKSELKEFFKIMNLKDAAYTLKIKSLDSEQSVRALKGALDQSIIGVYVAAKAKDVLLTPNFCEQVFMAGKLKGPDECTAANGFTEPNFNPDGIIDEQAAKKNGGGTHNSPPKAVPVPAPAPAPTKPVLPATGGNGKE